MNTVKGEIWERNLHEQPWQCGGIHMYLELGFIHPLPLLKTLGMNDY